MKTQSADTQPDAERVLIQLLRQAPVSTRFRVVQSLVRATQWANRHAWQKQHPDTSAREAAVALVSCWYGASLAAPLARALTLRDEWALHPLELLQMLLPMWQICEELQISCYVGGSLASSLHGMQQLAHDLDRVVELSEPHVAGFLSRLLSHYAFDEAVFYKALIEHRSCAVLHLDTLMKVDLILVKPTSFDQTIRPRARPYHLDDDIAPLPVASAEEMIFIKLCRYSQDLRTRTDGMRDDAQWNDVLGMLKVQGPLLEWGFLGEWSSRWEITEIFRQALRDAGIEHEEAA